MIRNNVSPLFAICTSSHFLCCHSNMTTTTSTTLPATSDTKNVGPRTSLDHKISATMSVLECIDKMELLSTFLDALAAKLLSPTSRKEATAISRDLKDAAKVNLTLALTIKANAQKYALVGNLLYVHNRFVDVRLLLGCFWLLLRFLNPNSPPRQATVVHEGR